MQKDLLRRSRRIVTVLSLIACLIMMAGCGERRAETPTRGRVTFSVSEEVLPLLRTAETRFEELYPEAEITLRPRPDREAIGDLFNDSVKLIVTARAMNAEEKAIQKKFNIEVNEFRIALDAVAIIVNNANDVTRLTLPGADSIFTGASMDWGLLGWNGSPGKINVYLPDKNSAACEVVAGRLPGLKPGRRGYTAPKKVCLTSRELISAVESDPAGIGIVGLNWMRNNTAAVRVVELSDPSAPESLGISGKYFAPHQAYVYKGYYPIVRDVYIYSTPDSYGVGSGFTSFMTGAAGQKIVQDQGLVPATMPVRLVELRNQNL